MLNLCNCVCAIIAALQRLCKTSAMSNQTLESEVPLDDIIVDSSSPPARKLQWEGLLLLQLVIYFLLTLVQKSLFSILFFYLNLFFSPELTGIQK